MSKNPYLAANRPSSSYTRSSRTSKRNDTSTSRGCGLLGRSRSSAALGGLWQSSYISSLSSASSYIPSTSSWQRSQSATNRPASSSSVAYARPSITSVDDKAADSGDCSRQPLERLTSSHSHSLDDDKKDDEAHLQNYQDNQIHQSRSLASIDSRRSASSIDTLSSGPDLGYADDDGSTTTGALTSGSVPKHLKQANLLKSNSLDISLRAADTSAYLSGSMSVDRLLLRSDSMTERELRRSYKDLVLENERLRNHLKSYDDKEKQCQQEWIRKERQLQRKISELEEENKQLDHWKEEMMRLKEENTSLIRVVSKLSKQH